MARTKQTMYNVGKTNVVIGRIYGRRLDRHRKQYWCLHHFNKRLFHHFGVSKFLPIMETGVKPQNLSLVI